MNAQRRESVLVPSQIPIGVDAQYGAPEYGRSDVVRMTFLARTQRRDLFAGNIESERQAGEQRPRDQSSRGGAKPARDGDRRPDFIIDAPRKSMIARVAGESKAHVHQVVLWRRSEIGNCAGAFHRHTVIISCFARDYRGRQPAVNCYAHAVEPATEIGGSGRHLDPVLPRRGFSHRVRWPEADSASTRSTAPISASISIGMFA